VDRAISGTDDGSQTPSLAQLFADEDVDFGLLPTLPGRIARLINGRDLSSMSRLQS